MTDVTSSSLDNLPIAVLHYDHTTNHREEPTTMPTTPSPAETRAFVAEVLADVDPDDDGLFADEVDDEWTIEDDFGRWAEAEGFDDPADLEDDLWI